MMALLPPRSRGSRSDCHSRNIASCFPRALVLALLLLVALPVPSAASHLASNAAIPGGKGDKAAMIGGGSPDQQHARSNLLETRASARRATRPNLADSQLRALLDLNAAWHLWPTNSNRSRRCDQWDYVQCSKQGFIIALELSDLDINATMPLNIFSTMPYLRRLVLAGDYFLHGSITHLSLPTSLRVLDVSDTSLSGWLPSTINSLPALTHLDVSDTPISGSLPSTILSLSALAHLDISDSSISGFLPSNLSRLSGLTYLNIGASNITGRVEDLSWASGLTNLHTLVMGRMLGVTGDFSALTFLTSLHAMQSLTITDVSWTGELPVLLGTLTSLTYLDLDGLPTTQFPRWVTDLPALRYLDVGHSHNYRSGVVPQDLSRLSQLQHFDASGNGLVGALPDYWTALNHLTFLSVSDNKIEGSIPSTFSALTALNELSLLGNKIEGSIPATFSALTSLINLLLRANRFSGPIPPFLGSLTGLTSLDLSDNDFTGAIPETLTNLTGVSQLFLSNNQLISRLEVVEKMTWLNTLDISFNNFSSGFPDLSSLPSLMFLDIGQNELDGPIPSDISKLSSLMSLHLNHNDFYGENPLGLFSLMNLDSLLLNNNRFSGRLPSTLVTGSLGTLNLQGNGISGPLPDFARWNTSIQGL